MNATPNAVVKESMALYDFIFRLVNERKVRCMVTLLASMTTVETQNDHGIGNNNQLPCALRTKKALVQPANIMQMLQMAIQRRSLCGCIF